MIGKQSGRQGELFIPGSLEGLIPDDHVLKPIDRVVDSSWLAAEVREAYCAESCFARRRRLRRDPVLREVYKPPWFGSLGASCGSTIVPRPGGPVNTVSDYRASCTCVRARAWEPSARAAVSSTR